MRLVIVPRVAPKIDHSEVTVKSKTYLNLLVDPGIGHIDQHGLFRTAQ